ncbi:hypothetical protein FA13DRAFT_1486462 [Coprinellus micaceus]|uniref:F-box domain-containing protein n=1 Tax=Coprinellus micaceus TaxID=71717 RepID=A0A4Y7TKN5_COPMI|nr:hypothetical protein FA13DRAFT_1486462 [Coprinellus micaceus]
MHKVLRRVFKPLENSILLVHSPEIKEMPLEIVFEIMSYLQPADLISLSRTSRRMREVLLSKSSRLVWRTSLSNVRGLPACPIDMAEPQFVNLIFGQNCQFCGKSGVKDIYWTCRARCCSNCVKSQCVCHLTWDDSPF